MPDAEGTPEPKTSPTSKGSRVFLLALPLATMVVAFGLWTVMRGESSKVPETALADIVIQHADLPEPSIRCFLSGDIQTYLQRLKDANADDAYKSEAQAWKQVQAKGGTAGYVERWGDRQEACDTIVTPSGSMGSASPDHSGGSTPRPTLTWSFVFRFKTPESAASAYKAIFGKLLSGKPSPNDQLTRGAKTGLGPNSSVRLTKATVPIQSAVWQNRSIIVLYGSENLPLDKSQQVAESINRRIT